MKNRELAENFAEGATKGNGSHMFIDDNVIYSYGYHFPIAIRLTSDYGFKYILNRKGYSMSTTKHKNYVASCIYEKDTILATDRIEEYKNMKNVNELKGIQKKIKNNLKIVEKMGLKAGYLLKNKLTGRIVRINDIHPDYGWVTCQDDELKEDYSNIDNFEIAYKEMIVNNL